MLFTKTTTVRIRRYVQAQHGCTQMQTRTTCVCTHAHGACIKEMSFRRHDSDTTKRRLFAQPDMYTEEPENPRIPLSPANRPRRRSGRKEGRFRQAGGCSTPDWKQVDHEGRKPYVRLRISQNKRGRGRRARSARWPSLHSRGNIIAAAVGVHAATSVASESVEKNSIDCSRGADRVQ